jgi:hypothetical protein
MGRHKRSFACTAPVFIGVLVLCVVVVLCATAVIIAVVETGDGRGGSGAAGACVRSLRRITNPGGRPWGVHAPLWGNVTATNLGRGCTVAFDQHAHTTASFDGVATPAELVAWHLRAGFNAFAVTDHNSFAGAAATIAAAEGLPIVVIPGVEWTTNRFHINVLFDPAGDMATYASVVANLPTTDVEPGTVADIVTSLHALGAVAVLNHPRYTRTHMDAPLDLAAALEAGVDFVEVVGYDYWDEDAAAFCFAHGLGVISGTDVHAIVGTKVPYTLLGAVPEISAGAVFGELKARRTVVSAVSGIAG